MWKLFEIQIPVFISQFLLNTAILIHLCVACDCFCMITAELGSCYRDPVVLFRESLSSSILQNTLTNIVFLGSSWQCATQVGQIGAALFCRWWMGLHGDLLWITWQSYNSVLGNILSVMLNFFPVLHYIYLRDAFVVAKIKYTEKLRTLLTGMLVKTFNE